MHKPSVLSQQNWPQKKKSKTRPMILGAVLMVVGFCTYLVVSDGFPWAQEAQAARAEAQETEHEEKTVLRVTEKSSNDIIFTKEEEAQLNEPSQPKIKKVSLEPSPAKDMRDIRVFHSSVKRSLDHTLCQKVEAEDCHLLAAIVARLLSWSMDVNRALRPGDQMHLVYETLPTKSKFRILKLEYTSQFLKRKLDINYYRTPSMSYGSYFDDEGLELTAHLGSSTAPIRDYSEITSLPGDFRQGREHAGTDFKAEVGTPVFSSFSGRVTRTNWNRGKNGFCVEIDHPKKGVKTVYLHLNRVQVRRGQNVRQGQQIGDSGNTGRSFAPHLHYEVRGRGVKKEIYNPFSFKYHRKYQRQISRKNLADYLKTVRQYDSFLREG